MTAKAKRFLFSTIKRNAPKRGPTSSDHWNDTMDEIVYDLAAIQDEWNKKIIPLLDLLPDGTVDSTVDAWKVGLDARTLYVDASTTSSSIIQTYYDPANSRPVSVKEALDDIYEYISTQVVSLNETIADNSDGLTSTQKERIGNNIFDSSTTSSATSIDGKSESNRLNLIQVARDVYGTGYTLDGDGQTNLTYSVAEMVDALLELHNGNWSDDVSLNHSGVGGGTQDTISPSTIYDDAFTGTPGDTEDDLNQIRTRIKAVAGTAAWTTALPALYTGGADSLKDLLDATTGSGTKASTNPWGYRYDNIDGLTAILTAIKSYLGQSSYTDSTPLYSGERFIDNGDPLEDAISVLDQELYDHMLDGHVSLPASEHWADSIQTETTARLLHSDLQDLLEWQCAPGSYYTGQQFRRHEEGFTGTELTVTHNRSSYPMVQLIQLEPDVTISGQVPYQVNHTSTNAFTLTLTSGVLASGVVIALW